jgi:hypothetical protein
MADIVRPVENGRSLRRGKRLVAAPGEFIPSQAAGWLAPYALDGSSLLPRRAETIFTSMPRLSQILALLAAIMIVIGGAPAMAKTQPCNPCPPDCQMMQQTSATSADNHAQTPGKGDQGDNPCKQSLACQAPAAAATAPSATVMVIAFSGDAVDHALADVLAAPSRPPDRNLRPPIQL